MTSEVSIYFNKSTRREQDHWALDRYRTLDKRADAIDEEYGIWKVWNHHLVDEKSLTSLKPLVSKHIHKGQGHILR